MKRSLTPDIGSGGPSHRPREGLWPGLICKLPKPLLVVPMVVQWLVLALRYRSLSLPSAADPMIDAGGLAGESKIAYFDQVGSAQGVHGWRARPPLFLAPTRRRERARR